MLFIKPYVNEVDQNISWEQFWGRMRTADHRGSHGIDYELGVK